MSDLMREYYPNGAPIIIQVAFEHGYGEAIVELGKKVYFNPDLSIAPAIMEAIQGLCLSSCDNQYCAVMHARGMVAEGFSLDDVKRLVRSQELPGFVENRHAWEVSLRRIASIFRHANVAPHLYESLHELHDPAVVEEIGGIIAFSLLHKFLLERYSDEIVIDEEPILFATVDCGHELIELFHTRMGDKTLPVYAICCLCKDIRNQDEWLPLEIAINKLPRDVVFSHGFCPKCEARQKDQD